MPGDSENDRHLRGQERRRQIEKLLPRRDRHQHDRGTFLDGAFHDVDGIVQLV